MSVSSHDAFVGDETTNLRRRPRLCRDVDQRVFTAALLAQSSRDKVKRRHMLWMATEKRAENPGSADGPVRIECHDVFVGSDCLGGVYVFDDDKIDGCGFIGGFSFSPGATAEKMCKVCHEPRKK